MFGSLISLLLLLLVPAVAFGQITPSQTQEIIRRSAQATHSDWERAPGLDFCETDKTKTGSRTSAVLMIEGSPFYRLVQVNGKDLSPDEEAAEQKRLEAMTDKRKHETPDARAKRIAQYQKERHRDQELLEQLTEAMNFTFVDQEVVDSHSVDVFDAVPKPGYVPKSMETEVLTGMKGKLWIDKGSFRWVRVEAQVERPVRIAGFLARVEPGTRFELEERPIEGANPDIWLPRHFTMQSRAKVLFLVNKSSQDDETYFDYKPTGTLAVDSCKTQTSRNNGESQGPQRKRGASLPQAHSILLEMM